MSTLDLKVLTQKKLDDTVVRIFENMITTVFGARKDIVNARQDATARIRWNGFVTFDIDPFFVPPSEDAIAKAIEENGGKYPTDMIRDEMLCPGLAAYEINASFIWGLEVTLTRWDLVRGDSEYGTDSRYNKTRVTKELRYYAHLDERQDVDTLAEILQCGMFVTKLVVPVEDPMGSPSSYV